MAHKEHLKMQASQPSEEEVAMGTPTLVSVTATFRYSDGSVTDHVTSGFRRGVTVNVLEEAWEDDPEPAATVREFRRGA